MTGFYETRGKRGLDAALATVSALAFSPLLAIAAVAIRIEGGGAALFKQARVGRDGKFFTIYKLRTMPTVTGDVPSGELEEPPPITRTGRVLRRTNIDELPQLFNILRGDMSIVGPRPPLPVQEDVIAMRRLNGSLRLRPGLTGLAQVRSYDDMPPETKAALDGLYAEHITLWVDLKIILQTMSYLLSPPPTY